MPAFSQNLEAALHRALKVANDRRHEYATLEHLLLALLDDRDAAETIQACKADPRLRQQVTEFLDRELGSLVVEGDPEAQPTTGFQRVIHRAVIHVQSARREEVTGADVLIAIFGEHESQAASLLMEHRVTRFDALQYRAHGIRKSAQGSIELVAEESQDFQYVCPECGAFARGVRNLRLICGACHRRMRASERR
jgi:ATP-dependent Clp protease ATP-binding subunit ClpA